MNIRLILYRITLAFFTLCISGALFTKVASAADFTVNSTNDVSDSSINGVCDIGTGSCTLRAAIEEANATVGSDNIFFNINGSGPHLITLSSALPTIINSVNIDASTQPGSLCNSLNDGLPHTLSIRIVGSSGVGFNITSSNVTIKGFSITNNSTSGINVASAANSVTVECNYIGMQTDGSTTGANTYGILSSASSDLLITNNLISGNSSHGIYINNAAVDQVTIEKNIIGLNANGTAARSNGDRGIYYNIASSIYSENNMIGGPDWSDRNIISGNASHGIEFFGAIRNSAVENNIVGLDISEENPIGNNLGVALNGFNGGWRNVNNIDITDNVIAGNNNHGVHIYESNNNNVISNYIGTNHDLDPGLGNNTIGVNLRGNAYNNRYNYIYQNTIVNNTNAGIIVSQGSISYSDKVKFNTISENTIYGNGIGISLDTNSVTYLVNPNDGATSVTYGNSMVDYPVVSNATLEGTTLTLDGFIGNAPGQSTYSGATVEFFKSENTIAVLGEIISGDSQSVQHGQAESYLGSCIADSDGTFGSITSCELSVSDLSVFDQITATSTHTNGSTSEFGANANISGAHLTSTLTYELTNDLNMNNELNIGDEVTFTLTTINSGNASASNLALNIPVPSFLTLVGNSATSNHGSIISGNSVNDSNVIVSIPSLSTEDISVITFKATILGNGTIELQATITSDNYPDYLSDDPEIAGLMDPTVLNVQAILASTGSNSLLLILTGIVILLTSLIHKISRNIPSLIKNSPVL